MRLFLALIICLATPLAAETRQHGNLVYDIPSGWVSGALRADGTRLLRAELAGEECKYCLILITPGARAGGRVDQWLAAQSRRFVEEDPDDPPTVTPMTASGVINLGGRPAAMLGQTVEGELQILVAVQLFGRMELIGFTAPARDEAGLSAAMKVLERDVLPMIDGLGFVSEGTKPLMPDPQPGAREGLWWGLSTSWIMGLDGMMTMQLDPHWLTFWPDGTFYDGTPPGGLKPLDRAALLDRGDMGWGSYHEAEGRLELTFASGEAESYTATDDSLTQGDLTLAAITPLPDGTKVDGSLSTFFYSGFSPGSGISGGISSSSLTRFHPDGSWDFGSSGGGSGSFDAGGGFATSADRSDAGRYEVKDGLLVQYDAKGQVLDRAWLFKDGSDIWIGSETLAK